MTDKASYPFLLSGAISGVCQHRDLVCFVLDGAQINACKLTSKGKRRVGSE
jgi:hypothetical protein